MAEQGHNYTMPGNRARELAGIQKEGLFRRIVKRLAGTPARAGATVVVTAGVVAGGVAAETTFQPGQTAAENIVGVVEQVSTDTTSHIGDTLSDAEGSIIYGKYLNRQEDGSFVLSDKPQVVKVAYVPNADPTTRHWNENNIVVRRKPEVDFGESNDVPPEEIKAPYAIRVAGGAFGGPSEVTRFQVTDSNGQKHTVGEWFKLSDEQGNPVNLDGTPLQEGESPYFIAANFVTVEATEPAPVK